MLITTESLTATLWPWLDFLDPTPLSLPPSLSNATSQSIVISGEQEEDEEDWFQPCWTYRNLSNATSQLIVISGE